MSNEQPLSAREEYEAWLRRAALELAMKHRPYQSLESAIEDAKRIEGYLMRPEGCQVLNLPKKRGQ